MDMNTFLTTLYVYVDDWYKAEIPDTIARRRGPDGQLSDSEVLTLALVGQWRWGVPWQSERGMVRYMQGEGRQWFPGMLGRSRYNERARCLWVVLIKLQQGLAEQLGSRTALYEGADCVPWPCCSTAQSRKKRHWLLWGTHGHGGTHDWNLGDQAVVGVQPEDRLTRCLIVPSSYS